MTTPWSTRRGRVEGAESAVDKLVLIRTDDRTKSLFKIIVSSLKNLIYPLTAPIPDYFSKMIPADNDTKSAPSEI